MGEDTSVYADAITGGDGGKIVVFAEDTARIYGNLSAHGGFLAGNGGFVETSGLRGFEIARTPDISADHGLGGRWLIDPYYNINIVAAPVMNNINLVNPFISTGEPSQIGVQFIHDALTDGATVLIQTGFNASATGQGDIIWDLTRPDGQPRRRLDTTRAKKEFGFVAKTRLEDGLRKTVEWYKKQKEFFI